MGKKTAKVTRFDYVGRLSNVETTQHGFMRIPANLARTGVLRYVQDGKEVFELRHPDDVMSEKSVKSLEDCPVTVGHVGMIRADRIEPSIGYIKTPKAEGGFIKGGVLVQKADAQDKIKNGELVDISPGYECEILNEPGEYQGQRYDRRQTNIIYNHIALLPKGQGRQGSEVSLRLDSKGNAVGEEEENMEFEQITARLDGKTVTLQVEKGKAAETLAAIERADKAVSERADAKEKAEKLEGQVEALKAENAKFKEHFDSLEVKALEEKAQKFDSKYKADGKSAVEVKKDILALAGMDKARFDSASEAYLDGMLSMVKEPAQKRSMSLGPQMGQNKETRQDETDPDAAYLEKLKRHSDAWKGGK